LGKSLTSKNRLIFVNFLFSINQQDRPAPVSVSNKFILSLSEHILTDVEEAVLMKGFNFFHNLSTLQPRYDMWCGIHCFQASRF
jgi:hypothetical protein